MRQTKLYPTLNFGDNFYKLDILGASYHTSVDVVEYNWNKQVIFETGQDTFFGGGGTFVFNILKYLDLKSELWFHAHKQSFRTQ